MQSVFFCILFVFFRFSFVFLQKKYEKIEKKYEKIRMQLLKNTKYKKKRNQQFQKYKIQKKIRTQNFKNTIYKEKTNSKISQRANPVFTVEIRKQIAKKIQNQPLVFSKPCNSDFVFLICLFFVFFLFLNMGRRPFCSHRGLLKYNLFALETFKRSTNFQWGSPLGCLSDLSGFGSPGALRFSRIDRALRLSYKEEL